MERKIGKLGLAPITATGFGHSGNPGNNGAPEFYLKDKLNLNIVYSVYHTPRTKEEMLKNLALRRFILRIKLIFLKIMVS